jgi:hypothetical protein
MIEADSQYCGKAKDREQDVHMYIPFAAIYCWLFADD